MKIHSCFTSRARVARHAFYVLPVGWVALLAPAAQSVPSLTVPPVLASSPSDVDAGRPQPTSVPATPASAVAELAAAIKSGNANAAAQAVQNRRALLNTGLSDPANATEIAKALEDADTSTASAASNAANIAQSIVELATGLPANAAKAARTLAAAASTVAAQPAVMTAAPAVAANTAHLASVVAKNRSVIGAAPAVAPKVFLLVTIITKGSHDRSQCREPQVRGVPMISSAPAGAALADRFQFSSMALAQTWANVGTDFATGTNWVGNIAPANDLTTNFASFATPAPTQQPSLAADRSVAGVEFASGAGSFTLSGAATLTLGDFGINNLTTAGTQTLSLPLALGAPSTFTNDGILVISGPLNNGGIDLTLAGSGTGGTISGVISGSGTLTKSGSGTWTLSGSNTFTGATSITDGVLKLGHALALQSSAVSIGIANGLDLNGLNATLGTLEGNGNLNLGATTLTVGGTGANASYSGVLSGTGTLVKTGAGNMTLLGENTHSGGIVINGGTVSIGGEIANADSYLGAASGGLTLAGGTLKIGSAFNSSRAVTLGAGGGTLELAADATFTGGFSGTGGLTKTGTSTLTLSATGSYSGATTISAGTLQLGAANALPTSSALTLSGGTLAVNGFNQGLGALTLGATSTIDFAGGGSTLTFANSSAQGWTGTLSILNYTSGTHTLKFGSSNAALTSTQLGLISFNGVGAQIDSFGNVSPIPEPSTYAAMFGCAMLGFAAWRRGKSSKRQDPRSRESPIVTAQPLEI